MTETLQVFFVFVFNIPPTAKVIWRWGHGLTCDPWFTRQACFFYMTETLQVFFVFVFVFNIPPTAKVIWRWGHGLTCDPWFTRQAVYPLHHRGS